MSFRGSSGFLKITCCSNKMTNDQLKNAMKDLSVETIALPEKRKPGVSGAKAEFLTNLTALTLKPNVPYYKYDIRMYVVYRRNGEEEQLRELTKQTKDDFPEQERKASTVIVYKYLLKTYKDVFPQNGAFFYDRAAVLFSAFQQVKLGGQEKELMLPVNVIKNAGEDATGIRVVIKKVSDGYQVTSNDLQKAVNVRSMERDKGVLEMLNLAMSQRGFLDTEKFVTYGTANHYLYDHTQFGFSDAEVPLLSDGKYMGIGMSKSVKVLEGDGGKSGTAFVVTDVMKGAFHIDDQNLLQKISQISIFVDARSGKSLFNVQEANDPRNQKSILQIIKGLYVTTTYGKKRTFAIGNIAAPANKLEFQLMDGKRQTVQQYFSDHHGIQLKFPGMFTVSERHKPNNYYPVELLTVAQSQRVTQQQQTPEQISTMIKASATLPQKRLQQTKIMKEALDIKPGSQVLASAGISVAKDFTKEEGRILPAPTIIYGKQQRVRPKDNCKWTVEKSEFLEPASFTNWAVCALLTPYDERRLQIKAYLTQLVERARLRGMTVEPASEIFMLKRNTPENIRDWVAAQKAKGRKFLMFLSSNSIKMHSYIKLLEVNFQIATQEILGNKVDDVVVKRQNQTLDNVLAKINLKLGGVNHNIVLGAKPAPNFNWLESKDCLFIGLSISNPPAISQGELDRGATYKMPSVLGWSANCSKNYQNFIGDYVYVQARQADMMGAKLGKIVVDIIARFRSATANDPRHILLYFSGISEGQWGMVADTYMRAIRTGIASIALKTKPTLTAVVCTSDHNERIYKSPIVGRNASEQNVPPGTVVDTKIVSPVINEFYLNSHSAFQGTAKTPKYSLVFDDSNIPMDALELITHGLCYLHAIVPATVSEPVPLFVAADSAERGHDNFIANSTMGFIPVGSIDEANAKLVNSGELKSIRYNA
ncbi:hypothetical protein Aduo_002862 [Ancylostoma duodenale]